MAKQVVKKIKLQAPAGNANAQLGTVLGPAGINIQEFCTKFNEQTSDQRGDILPVEISIYEDRSFDFIVKTPPAAFLIKKTASLKKGSAKGRMEQVATISDKQLEEIAKTKLPDLNTDDIEEAKKIVAGTAKNMGVAIEGQVLATEEELAEAKAYEAEMARLDAEEAAEKEAAAIETVEESTEEPAKEEPTEE